MKTQLTDDQVRRAEQALTETRLMLNKELKYSTDLQNVERIEFYKNHIRTLENMLYENQWEAPEFN